MQFPTQNFNNGLTTFEELQFNHQLSHPIFDSSFFSFSTTIIQINNSNEDTSSWDHSFTPESQSNSIFYPIQNQYILNDDENLYHPMLAI